MPTKGEESTALERHLGIDDDCIGKRDRSPALRQPAKPRRVSQHDVIPINHIPKTLRDAMPVEDIHAHGQVRFFKRFFQTRQSSLRQRTFADHDEVQIGVLACRPGHAGTVRAHLAIGDVFPEDVLDGFEVVRREVNHCALPTAAGAIVCHA